MPELYYVGDAGRYYPHVTHADAPGGRGGLVPVPGESYDIDTDPADGRWTDDPSAARAAATTHAQEG